MDSTDTDMSAYSDWVLFKVGNGTACPLGPEEYRLKKGVNSIGRHSASDIRIYSVHVSRHHAEITIPEYGTVIEMKDLNSINGIFINKNHHRNCVGIVKPGDIISFCAEYEDEDAWQLPIYSLHLKPLNPFKSRESSPIPEIVISDDDEKDIKPVIIPNLAPETIAVSNILTIFGNVNDIILDGLQKINPVVCEAVKQTSNAELVVLSSDDEESENKRKIKPLVAQQDKSNENNQIQRKSSTNEGETDDQIEQINYLDSNDENQIVYSQALLDEMKSEMAEDNDEIEKNVQQRNSETFSPQIISLIDDDNDDLFEDYHDDVDEDLEKKVSSWKNLLFNSQVFPKMNCSQKLVSDDNQTDEFNYGDESPMNNPERESAASERSLIENLFRPLEEKLDDKQICKKRTHEKTSKENLDTSPVIKKRKRKIMRIEDYSDDDDREAVNNNRTEMHTTPPNSPKVPTKTIRGPQIISPPHIKVGRGRSISIAEKEKPKKEEKKRRKSVDHRLKEIRKESLKKISSAEKSKINKNNEATTSIKERRDSSHQNSKNINVAKVKVTLHNRGAFLCDDRCEVKKPVPSKKDVKSPAQSKHNVKKPIAGSPTSIVVPKPDVLNKNSSCSNEINQIIRKNAEKARARNAPKKLRFADIEKSYDEHQKIEEKVQELATKLVTNSVLSNQPAEEASLQTSDSDENDIIIPNPDYNQGTLEKSDNDENDIIIPNPNYVEVTALPQKPKKVVRFVDEPTIYYIESLCPYSRKVDRKDIMPRLSYRHRRNFIRLSFPDIDRTDLIISIILAHSNEWLHNHSSPITAPAQLQKLYPMPNQFDSFGHYKRIVLPLMKLEYTSSLKRDVETNLKIKPWSLTIDDIINNNERVLIVAKGTSHEGKQLPHKKSDLVLLTIGERIVKTFGYMVNCNKIGALGYRLSASYFIEILPSSVDSNYLRKSKSIFIQPITDNLQVTIGAYNAIFKLESTPLYEMILNPTVLLQQTKILATECDDEIASDFIHDNLNTEQLNAVKQIYKKICLNRTETTPNVSVIQGPPGTGKSVVVINLALQILYGLGSKFRDKKILICAQSNCAIDSVAAKLLEARFRIKEKKNRFQMVRFGIFEKMHSKVHPVSLHNMLEFERVKKLSHNFPSQFMSVSAWKSHLQKLGDEINSLEFQSQYPNMPSLEVKARLKMKKQEMDLLTNAYKNALSGEEEYRAIKNYMGLCNIVCTTLSSCVKLLQYVNECFQIILHEEVHGCCKMWIDYFDVCIIDEATQCTEPWTLLPLKFGISSLVLVGDSQQLPATVLSKLAIEYGLSRSLHTRIETSIIDQIQGSQSIPRNSNVLFSLRVQYRMHPEICRFPNIFFYKNTLKNGDNTLMHTTSLLPYSVFNLEYAQNRSSVQGKIRNHLEADFVVDLLKALNEFIPIERSSYGIITPYAHQRKILAEAVTNARLPHVTVNTIDSYQGIEKDVIIISNARTDGIGFLANPQRLNVAITRPKKCLIICGNFRNLQSVPAWRCLLKDAQQRGVYYDIDELDAIDIKTKVIQRILVKK